MTLTKRLPSLLLEALNPTTLKITSQSGRISITNLKNLSKEDNLIPRAHFMTKFTLLEVVTCSTAKDK